MFFRLIQKYCTITWYGNETKNTSSNYNKLDAQILQEYYGDIKIHDGTSLYMGNSLYVSLSLKWTFPPLLWHDFSFIK